MVIQMDFHLRNYTQKLPFQKITDKTGVHILTRCESRLMIRFTVDSLT